MAADESMERDNLDPIQALLEAGQYREAISACIQNYSDAIGKLCMALLGDQEAARDAVQETLVAAYDRMPSRERDKDTRIWILTIAYRMCVRRLESDPRFRKLSSADSAQCVSNQSDDKEGRRRSIRKALMHLLPSERDAAILHYQAGLSFQDIAKINGKEEALVRKQISRALLRLRENFKDEVQR